MFLAVILGLIIVALASIIFLFTLRIGFVNVHLFPLSLSISSFHFAHTHKSFSTSHITLSFYLPSPTSPSWASINVHNVDFKSRTHHLTVSHVVANLWFFPALFRSQLSPVSAELHDFRLQVFSSQETPRWVQALRRNLIYTVLNEETLRLDSFKVSTTVRTMKPEYARQEGKSESTQPGNSEESENESRITNYFSQWHIHNHISSRLYAFGSGTAQLRRRWTDGTGVFVLITQECRWIQVFPESSHKSSPSWRESLVSMPLTESLPSKWRWWFSIFLNIVLFSAWDMLKTLGTLSTSPVLLVDLYVPQADITFDRFRIHDSEVFQQGAAALKRTWDENSSWAPDAARDFIIDGISSCLGF